MSLPTLLKPGSIVPQKWMTKEQKHRLKTQRSIDWIIDYLIDRAWDRKTPPKIKIKGPGSRVGVFRSGTGTGKSTVFPPEIYNEFYEKRGLKKNIICTQPTIATATDIPFQILMFNKNLKMGETIGYQTGSLVRKPVKGILFATIGILLQHLKLLTDEDFMKKYSYIILDEIHLRSVETDTTLFYLRRFLERNYEDPECPYVILTSGTFDPEPLMDYFSCPKDSFLDIVGSSFPIEEHYASFDITDYITYAVDLAEKIHVENISDITDNNLFRDILIFVQGGGQIKEIVDRIHKLNTTVFSKGLEFAKQHSEEQQKKYTGGRHTELEIYYICPVSVTSENMQKGEIEYQNTFSPIESVVIPIYEFDATGTITEKIIETVPASRRVLIATNAIETGLTIDTLKYCIDTGFVNEAQFNPNFGAVTLMNKSVTQASTRQRKGRVGRKDPGVFFGCYTKETYDALVPLPHPDIIKADVTTSLLDAIINETETKLEEVAVPDLPKDPDGNPIMPFGAFQMNQFDQRWYNLHHIKDFDLSNLIYMQTPAADSFKYSLEKLRILGLIDHEYHATTLGWYASKFRKVEIENARMILAGYHHGANVIDLITITCFLQAGFKLGIKRNKYKPRNPIKVPESEVNLYYNMVIADEFIEYIFIWNDFMDNIADISHAAVTGKIDNPLDNVKKWADDNKFNMDTLLSIIASRDELITDLLNLGMNPFYNGMGLPRGKYNLSKIISANLQDGVQEIQKIKKCIYEGYRLNLHIWNETLKGYISVKNHNRVSLDSKILKGVIHVGQDDADFKQQRPKNIIVANTMIRQSQTNKGMYEFLGSDISVLDGYVEPDLNF
jgi:HrpA-like RNA helicase